MGRMKDYAMELEDQFWEIAGEQVSEHETFLAYVDYLMANHYENIMHLEEEDVMHELNEYWGEYHQKYAEMQEPVESEEE